MIQRQGRDNKSQVNTNNLKIFQKCKVVHANLTREDIFGRKRKEKK